MSGGVPLESVAIVTGGASGIGLALVRALLAAGARVALVDRSAAVAQHAADGVSGADDRLRAYGVDVTDAAAFEALAVDVQARWVRIDYLFNNAGIGMAGAVADTTLDDWKRVLDVNLWGVIHGVQAVYPRMLAQGRGHIVNTASGAGLGPRPFMAVYAASKHAVVGLSTSMRGEAAPLGVKISVVCPGNIASNMLGTTTFRNLDGDGLRRAIPFKPMSADECARRILRGVARNKAIIPVQWIASVEWWLYRISPGLYAKVSDFRAAKFRAHQGVRGT